MRVRLPIIKFSVKTFELGNKHRRYYSDLPKKSRAKVYIVCSFIFLFFIFGIYVRHMLTSPNEGQVALPVQDNSAVPKIAEFQTLTTSFYSLDYSGRYSQQPTDINPAGVLDYKVLAYSIDSQSKPSKIEITIKHAPDGGITLDSSYDYYQKHPDQYKLSNQLSRGEIIDIAKNTKVNPEIAGMWLHNNLLMIVKITTPDTHQNIETELKGILSSVQWQQ